MLGNAVLMQYDRLLGAAASSDEQLLADFLSRRSDNAFSALIGRHGPMVLNVCRRILHDAHAAEDVFQATFLVLAERADTIRRRTSLAGFLHSVAYRLAVRARRRGSQNLPADLCDEAEGPPDGLAWKEMLGILDHELGRLSDRYRAPLVLCYLEGRTQDEAARQLGLGLNTLRRRLAQGRGLLEARLRGRGVSLPAALAGLLAASAAAVPGRLRAATLAAAGSRAVGGLTAGASVLTAVRTGLCGLLSASGKKVGPVAVLAALGAAVCFGYCLTPPANQLPPASAPADGAVRGDSAADPLTAQGTLRLGTDRYRHGPRIECLAVSADGKRAATSSGWPSLMSARVFDLADGRCLYTLPNEPGSATEAVALSPDGKTLATRQGNTVHLRDAATGKDRHKIELPGTPGGRTITRWLSFTPDGRHLAATPSGNVIYLIHVETQDVVGTFPHDGAVLACVFSPDGKTMAAGGYESEKGVYFARMWDVATGKELRRFTAGDGRLRSLAFSPDGATLAGGGGDARLRLWEAATGKELKVFPKIGRRIESVAFAPDGKTVAAAGDSVQLYDAATGKERLRIDRQAQGLAFSQDGSVLTGAVSGAIYRWDAATGRPLTPTAAQDSAAEQILVTSNGRRVLTVDQDGDLHAWDTAGGSSPRRIVGGIERGIVASPGGGLLAWAVEDDSVRTPDPSHPNAAHAGSRVRLYDVSAERFIDRLPAVKDEASVAAFLPGGKTVLTLDRRTATVRLWDVESGKERRSFPASPRTDEAIPYAARRAALSPDGKTLAIGYGRADNISTKYRGVPVRLWDVATGKAGHELNGHMNSVDGLAFSPDGQFLATWAENPFGAAGAGERRGHIDRVFVWDVTTGRAVPTLYSGLPVGAGSAAFSPDGRTLATASADGAIRLWEVATWTVRAEFRGHRDRVTALAFGPDGRLFSGGLDTTVLGWDVRPPRGAAKGNLADAWEALGDSDGKAGFGAQGRFLAEPAGAVEWFKGRLTPAGLPDPSRVKALIADLDNDDFATRERATAKLKDHWPVAAAALREVAAKSPSAEARRRAEDLLREMKNVVTPPGELRALRAAEVLEWVATKEARHLLLGLTKGAPEARLTREAVAAGKRLEGRE
jgi:RNA polymerase sigma factor (sigma-70 family)